MAVAARPTTASRVSLSKRIGWGVMLTLAILLFLLAARYLTLSPEVFFPEQKAVYLAHLTGLIVHIVGAMVATIIGPFQFLPSVNSGRYQYLHRWLGRIYLLGVLVGGLGGLYMAQYAYGGFASSLGFSILAVLWMGTGFLAYRNIRRRRIQVHRQWMIRNYALTFAAVALRIWMPLFQIGGIDQMQGYVAIAWLCWVPNLMVAEYIVDPVRNGQRRATAAA